MKFDSLAATRLCAIALFGFVSNWVTTAKTAVAYEVVRIDSVNGIYNPNHVQVLEVTPGEVVSLTADVFHERDSRFEPQYHSHQNFLWKANDRYGNECDAAYPDACSNSSDFEITEDGIVNYYLPYQFIQDIQISVRSKSHWDEDTIVLRNRYQHLGAPTEVISSSEEYFQYYPHHDEIIPEYYLAGQGRWVWIRGKKYWSPYFYEEQWAPYQNGYWTWVNSLGWTWISYDPWGELTDHYGYWRYHQTYGWIWAPFPKKYYYYHAHVVTFYHSDTYVGWYPYYDQYRGYLYGQGYEDGFRDGFWLGYQAGRHYGSHNHYWYIGHTVIEWRSFGQVRIRPRILIRDRSLQIYRDCFRRRTYGLWPGGKNRKDSYAWVRKRVHVPTTDVVKVGRRKFQYAKRVHAEPRRDGRVGRKGNSRLRGKVSVGSRIQRDANGSTRVIAPKRTTRRSQDNPRVKPKQRQNTTPRTRAGRTPRGSDSRNRRTTPPPNRKQRPGNVNRGNRGRGTTKARPPQGNKVKRTPPPTTRQNPPRTGRSQPRSQPTARNRSGNTRKVNPPPRGNGNRSARTSRGRNNSSKGRVQPNRSRSKAQKSKNSRGSQSSKGRGRNSRNKKS